VSLTFIDYNVPKSITHGVQHANSHVQVVWMAADDDQSFARVDNSTGCRWGTRVGHSDVTLGLGSDFVDLDSSLSDDCD
jgi:hypothetical protein